ncbi:hypothetical protein ACFLZ7_00605 [Nanoarchaeota archaeon]
MIDNDLFMISPVRETTDAIDGFLRQWGGFLKKEGYSPHYPLDHTNQKAGGLEICTENREGMRRAIKGVVMYCMPTSAGSSFDSGMVFMRDSPFFILNSGDIDLRSPGLSPDQKNYLQFLFNLASDSRRRNPEFYENMAKVRAELMGSESAPMRVSGDDSNLDADSSEFFKYMIEGRQEIKDSNFVKYEWKGPKDPRGLAYLGMAFMSEKALLAINRNEIERTPEKSFNNVVLDLDKRCRARLPKELQGQYR